MCRITLGNISRMPCLMLDGEINRLYIRHYTTDNVQGLSQTLAHLQLQVNSSAKLIQTSDRYVCAYFTLLYFILQRKLHSAMNHTPGLGVS